MSFTIDRQSLDELNLMGKFKQGSVYSLFNQVKTRGGEQLLDQLFRNPLTDENIINQRTAVFRFFQEARLQFPFDPQQVLQMREYIDVGAGSTQLSTFAGILLKKTLSALTRDERFKALIQGLQATIITLKKCLTIAEQLQLMGGPFLNRIQEVRSILQTPELAGLIETDIYSDIPVRRIASYDHLLKNRFNAQVVDLLHFIAELDVNIAVGNVAFSKGFTWAAAMPKAANMLRANGLKHPCIDNAIGNDIAMQHKSNVIFLTGANMAGKSTWMKTIGISLYLSHIGFPVAAGSMEFSVREGIYSSINVSDNIALGYSHFYAEVVRVKQAANSTCTGRHLLLMFDELFKGTNVKDAFDGTLAVTQAFAEYENCLFIVSTHIIEVGEQLKHRNNIQFKYMPTMLEANIPRYTYRLKDGITEDRQGMMIIKNEGIIEMIGD
ncbi:MutS-related protein [Pseudobacter ginsenosidimutans]|uniref:MutS-like protein n=1 Tax=Pseudobacter ginsenosidimutans TaxID=661488 RepID=A0A4Q7N587_9BACT|nr:DNA mismatch repair protein [Pseudobacter ginsenosidimutans]QEC44724.1 DNA mismatch repair protein [Pseudobacter ginsenosidimutans]RZS76205.1 MutS-like protein [Pseudobacter ginsenosidimutans]